MESSQPPGGTAPGSLKKYKRASRRGAPKRFACDHPGCDRIYSRAEHLQRHQLNHNPTEIYRCDVPGCGQSFVRADLLARHKKRHTASYIPRNRGLNFVTSDGDGVESPTDPKAALQQPLNPGAHSGGHPGPHDAATVLLTPESAVNSAPVTLPISLPSATNEPAAVWSPPIQTPVSMPQSAFYDVRMVPDPAAPPAPFQAVGYGPKDLARDTFAAWLFDPQTNFHDFNMTGIPFLEAGLESTFNNDIHYDYEPLSRSQGLTPPHYDASDELMTEARRQEVLQWFRIFRQKQPCYEGSLVGLVDDSGGDMPVLNVDMMRICLREFWEYVSPRLPIVHQHTFLVNQCPILLLLVMLALGAASRRGRDMTGQSTGYDGFADVIIASVRWEISTSEDAVPPISLWAAQALLLLEFYEKLYSSRKFHERAHIYHSSFLTLLRRGSPLIGRAGSESPPEPDQQDDPEQSSDSKTWWIRWAETESMHRVVFGAFMLDITHAAMFGHVADMAAHEIRLPLPCDYSLWTANSPDIVRQLEANFRMYGVKQVSFLDGLKTALHGKEVKTHSFGRMIIMSGLLSVGWHLRHRERHMGWLDIGSSEPRENWRKMVLSAFDRWKDSFDRAMVDSSPLGLSERTANGPINSASLLYHLAHFSLHVDIVDCQVYAGAKLLVGRRVSSRDYTNVVKRMSSWAKLPSTRHAVLHAFKLLHSVLVGPPSRRRNLSEFTVRYSLRSEIDPNRPWVVYYAALSIWAFVQALGRAGRGYPVLSQAGTERRMAEYLSRVAAFDALDEQVCSTLFDGLPELLQVIEELLGDASSELLAEARVRLKACRDMLMGATR